MGVYKMENKKLLIKTLQNKNNNFSLLIMADLFTVFKSEKGFCLLQDGYYQLTGTKITQKTSKPMVFSDGAQYNPFGKFNYSTFKIFQKALRKLKKGQLFYDNKIISIIENLDNVKRQININEV